MRDFASKPRQEAAKLLLPVWSGIVGFVELWVLTLGSFLSGPSEEEHSAWKRSHPLVPCVFFFQCGGFLFLGFVV
jgi:hypothetical protein